jgi:hypothetical protein
MIHPDMMSAKGKLRFDHMLESAEQYRRAKRLHRDRRGLYSRAASYVSYVLTALGSRIKAQLASDDEVPALTA